MIPVIRHLDPVSVGSCDPFVFQNITTGATLASTPVFSSTAVTTADVTISGTVVRCGTSQNPALSAQIGPDVTLCIPGMLELQ